jgi:hypothetical protein
VAENAVIELGGLGKRVDSQKITNILVILMGAISSPPGRSHSQHS